MMMDAGLFYYVHDAGNCVNHHPPFGNNHNNIRIVKIKNRLAALDVENKKGEISALTLSTGGAVSSGFPQRSSEVRDLSKISAHFTSCRSRQMSCK